MAAKKPHVDVRGILKTHSRRLLNEFREGEQTSPNALDRGLPREKAVFDFLTAKLPGRYGVGNGIVVDAKEGQSLQCDVVIFDSQHTPKLSTSSAMSIWPFDVVYCVAEVKSKLTEAALSEAVENIASFKKLQRPARQLAGGPGFVANVGFMNPPFGVVIAHAWGDDLMPTGPAYREAFDKIVQSVPAEQQIDAYCVIEGGGGCRAKVSEDGRRTVFGLFPNEQERPPLVHLRSLEDSALAWFLLILTSLLNTIDLGEPNLVPYLRYVADKPTATKP